MKKLLSLGLLGIVFAIATLPADARLANNAWNIAADGGGVGPVQSTLLFAPNAVPKVVSIVNNAGGSPVFCVLVKPGLFLGLGVVTPGASKNFTVPAGWGCLLVDARRDTLGASGTWR